MLAGIGGHAVLGDAEHARDLYAAAAAAWHDAGHARHDVFVPVVTTPRSSTRGSGSASAQPPRSRRARRRRSLPPSRRRDPARNAGRPRRRGAARPGDDASRCCLSPSFSERAPRRTTRCVEDWRGTRGTKSSSCTSSPSATGASSAHILLYKRPHDLRVPRDSIDLAARVDVACGARLGRGARAHRARRPLGARERVPDDDHGLADDEPPRVAVLAEARLPPDVPAAVPGPALTRIPLLAGSRIAVVSANDDAVVLAPPPPREAVADVARGRARLAPLSARGRAARDARHARRTRDGRHRAAGAAGSRRRRSSRVRRRSRWRSTSSSAQAFRPSG